VRIPQWPAREERRGGSRPQEARERGNAAFTCPSSAQFNMSWQEEDGRVAACVYEAARSRRACDVSGEFIRLQAQAIVRVRPREAQAEARLFE